MAIDLFDGVSLIGEAALTTATGECGIWGSGSAADPSLWDSATWGPDETFVDILKAEDGTKLLRSLTTNREFSHEVQRWDGGTATAVLTNLRGRFSSSNLSGPFVAGGISGIRSLVPIRWLATYQGVTYPLYRGYVEEWLRDYDPTNADALVTIPQTDEWARLSVAGGVKVPAAGAGELFGPRCHRILDAAGHTGARVIDVGTTTMQATDLDKKAADELALTADSEGGSVYIGAAGEVIGERQYALVENARSIVVQAVFGDNPAAGEIPYSDLKPTTSAKQVVNIASYQRVGGTAQVRADAMSRALCRDRTDPRTDLVCETDAQADTLAAWKVARCKDPEDRFSLIELRPRHAKYGAKLWPQVLGRQVRDLIQVWRRPPGEDPMVRYCHIAGISHEITQDDWVTRFALWSATPYLRFASSRFDVGTWGASDTDATAAVWFY
jgi:hypothetical protein